MQSTTAGGAQCCALCKVHVCPTALQNRTPCTPAPLFLFLHSCSLTPTLIIPAHSLRTDHLCAPHTRAALRTFLFWKAPSCNTQNSVAPAYVQTQKKYGPREHLLYDRQEEHSISFLGKPYHQPATMVACASSHLTLHPFRFIKSY